jgi:hypothetical protein
MTYLNDFPRASSISAPEVLAIVDVLLTNSHPRSPMSDVQSIVLYNTWEGWSYQQIADNFGYHVDYVRQIASLLWQALSVALGEKVSKKKLHSVLRRYQRHHSLIIHSAEVEIATGRQDWGEAIDVSIFHGRQSELTKLEQWIAWNRCRLVSICGLGGIGKTTFSIKLAQKLASQFDHIVWRSLKQAPLPQVLCAEVVAVLLGNTTIVEPATAISVLLQQLQEKRCLLILDGVDAILQAGEQTGECLPGYENYHQLFDHLANVPHQSCLLLTSREQPQGLAQWSGDHLPVRSITLKGLSGVAGQQILADKGLVASSLDQDLLINHFGGNPQALKMAATKIQHLFGGDLAQFLAQGSTVFSDLWELFDRQFQRLSPLQRSLMYWVATHPGGCAVQLLQAKVQVPMREVLAALEALQQRSLIESDQTGLIQQPAISEYVAGQPEHGRH